MKNLLFGTDSNTAGATAHNPNTESNQSDIVLAQLSQVEYVLHRQLRFYKNIILNVNKFLS